MFFLRTLCTLFIILVIEVILSSRGHSDCNHKRVVDQFFYMCNSYDPPSKKRETKAGEGPSPEMIQIQQQQQQQQQQHHLNPLVPMFDENPTQFQQQIQQPSDGGGNYPAIIHTIPKSPTTPTETAAPPYSLKGSSNQRSNKNLNAPLNAEDHHHISSRKQQYPAASAGGAALPNEPEDLASFNSWYLNPVLADAEWQSAIDRWRRKSHINEEIWRFVRNKCCVNGCAFPDDYWELDKHVNICGMK